MWLCEGEDSHQSKARGAAASHDPFEEKTWGLHFHEPHLMEKVCAPPPALLVSGCTGCNSAGATACETLPKRKTTHSLRPLHITAPVEQKHMARRLLLVGGAFMGIHQFILRVAAPILFKHFDGKVYASLGKRGQWDLDMYAAAVVHHLIVIGPSLWSVWQDAVAPTSRANDYSFMQDVAGISLGYFVGDSLALLPDWLKGKGLDYIAHHGAGIILILGPVALSSVALRWTPWFLQTEVTTILLALMYYLRKTGRADGALYANASLAFAALFFLLRCVALPCAVHSLTETHKFEKERFASLRYVFYTVALLQFYWGSKIAKQLVARFAA